MINMKKLILAMFFSLLLSFILFSGCIQETSEIEEPNNIEKFKMIYVDDDGGADFTKIQDAIDNVGNGSTIFVNNGTYYEMLIIDKSLNLIGESENKTIIDYQIGSPQSENAIIVNANDCKIKGFKIICDNYTSNKIVINIKSSNNIISNNIISNEGILYSHKAVYIDMYTMNNTISENTIINVRNGIESFNSDYNNILNNNLSSNEAYGIYLLDSNNNIITGNIISYNTYGIRIQDSRNNKVFENTIISNENGLYFCCGSKNNMVYLNIFEQNSVYNANDTISNQWDNGSIGNYWDDYIENHPDAKQINGIWDIPYNVTGGDNIDRFPLVNLMDI